MLGVGCWVLVPELTIEGTEDAEGLGSQWAWGNGPDWFSQSPGVGGSCGPWLFSCGIWLSEDVTETTDLLA